MLNSLNEAARPGVALEAMMKGYEYQSDFAKQYVAQGERTLLLRRLRTRFAEDHGRELAAQQAAAADAASRRC